MSTILHSPFKFQKIHNNLFTKRKMRREQVHSVQRILFGEVDHESSQKFVQEILDRQLEDASKKWNFDFKNQKPLDEDGNYIWKPATPDNKMKIIKRRPSDEIEFDTGAFYFQPIDINNRQQQNFDDCRKNSTPTIPKQSLITDYMTTKKRAASDYQKKASLSERPAKIPKLNIAS